MVLLLICWFCIGELIAFALNMSLGEWIHNNTIYCLLYVVKNFHCFMSLPSFPTNHFWLLAITSFHSIHVQTFAK